ncbi:unnamed protein product [Mytilus coruscus]|uniref:Reverse transcriptase Ty1/copia-type domain-containing protein n=1 Tax=Mytilus coruscus TaxID=42192 RepID=A0A6J8BV14_MYTCO|nr:unnamed protein product [Mytilus coruscus]
MPVDDNPGEGVVLSRAGKASSNSRNWYNVEYRTPEDLRGNKISIDLSRVDELEVVKSETNQYIEDDEESEEVFFNEIDFCDARKAELENWKRHNVYKEVEDFGQSCVSTRWVYTITEIYTKARLVAKGFEEDCLDEIQKNSPTCDKKSLTLILTIIMQKQWLINSIDIITAFLKGEKMQRKVHLRPPKEANANGKIWLLKKCVYGLADASLKWYEKVKKTLNECGGTESKIDPAVFYWHDSNGLVRVLAVHVDDFLWAGTNLFETEIKNRTTVVACKTNIAFDIAMITSKLKTSTIEDLKRVNKLLRKVRNDPVSLHFKQLGEYGELLLYTDASFGNLPDGGSQGGFVIMVLGETRKINPVK